MRDQQMCVTKSLKAYINDAVSVTLSPTMPPKSRKKKKSSTAPKEDVQAINVGTSSKGIEKPEEIASPFPREPSTVSMEGVESTEIAPSTKDREVTSTTPSVEEIKRWSPEQVISFLKSKKNELYLREEDIKIIEDNWVAGQAFILLTEEKLMSIGLKLGPTSSIAYLIETLKGGEVTLKRKYEESTENLTEIVKSAVREEFSRQKPDVISVSKLSETMMKKIMDDIGIKTAKLSVEDFLPLEPVSCEPFRWDIEQEEVQQMQDVEKWFKNVLSLPRNFHVKDVHKQVTYQRHLRGANTIITGGADISVGPSETACVWIETKKTLEDFKEGQAMG
ncbi:9350_t:CDS:2, partial [Funneliformis geosporum]